MLGTLAGAIGGGVDSFVMRLVDVMLSIPSLLLAFTIASLARNPSQWTLIVSIAVIQVPIFARLLRGSMLAQRSSDHVLAARSLGVRPRRDRVQAHAAQLDRPGDRPGDARRSRSRSSRPPRSRSWGWATPIRDNRSGGRC